MAEVQRHGFDFESWVTRTFFPSAVTRSYSQKWDVVSGENNCSKVPSRFQHLPVSIKTAKYGQSIGFGDAMRQFSIDGDFVLIVGFWKQQGVLKNFVAVEGLLVDRAYWNSLFAPLTREELQTLDELIKDRDQHYKLVRSGAKAMKALESFQKTRIVLNPKIDSKTQRRLQCSLPFTEFWSGLMHKKPEQTDEPTLFDVPVPNPFVSGPRVLNP